MARVRDYDEIKRAFQDFLVPELRTIREDLRLLGQEIDGVGAPRPAKVDALRAEMLSLKGDLLVEVRRLDARIDGVDRELRRALDIRERLAALETRRLC